MEIPHEQLDEATLRNLVEELVTRDGTDYGEREVSLQDKVAQVLARLKRGEAMITYDPDTRSCAIVPRHGR